MFDLFFSTYEQAFGLSRRLTDLIVYLAATGSELGFAPIWANLMFSGFCCKRMELLTQLFNQSIHFWMEIKSDWLNRG